MNDILIVDDDIELCELIKRRGMQENIFADYCLSGKSALHKLHEKEYQLIVLDVMMPNMDGFEILNCIRKKSQVPILMLTSKTTAFQKYMGYVLEQMII